MYDRGGADQCAEGMGDEPAIETCAGAGRDGGVSKVYIRWVVVPPDVRQCEAELHMGESCGVAVATMAGGRGGETIPVFRDAVEVSSK